MAAFYSVLSNTLKKHWTHAFFNSLEISGTAATHTAGYIPNTGPSMQTCIYMQLSHDASHCTWWKESIPISTTVI